MKPKLHYLTSLLRLRYIENKQVSDITASTTLGTQLHAVWRNFLNKTIVKSDSI